MPFRGKRSYRRNRAKSFRGGILINIHTAKKGIIATALIITSLLCLGAEGADIRGQVATEGSDFTWNPQNFPGFYYDPDRDLGTETLEISPAGNGADIRYTTTAQREEFQFGDWGYYNVLGFLGKKYFAGYASRSKEEPLSLLQEESKDKDLLSRGQISEVLLDDDVERVLTAGMFLRLEGGYELLIQKISEKDRNVYLELFKDGVIIDSKVLSPSKDNANMADKTYCYKKDMGEAEGVIVLAAHFKNAYNDSEVAVVTMDGLWQISDKPRLLKAGSKLGAMKVEDISGTTIAMITDGSMTINKGDDLQLMGDLHIKAADQKIVDSKSPLRYYPYMNGDDSKVEVRSSMATGDFTWNPQNFDGLCYDIGDDLGTETLTTTVTEGNMLSGDAPYGVTYQTTAQRKGFKFEGWGYYNAIAFLSKNRFAGYSLDEEDYNKNYLYQESKDENSLASQQLLDVLIDDNKEQILDKGEKLELKDGYELQLKGVDSSGRIYVELFKDGDLVDSRVMAPGVEYATMADKTYTYRRDVGAQRGLLIIAVHFKNAYRNANVGAEVDGIWQISTAPISMAVDEKYGIMAVQYTTVDSIVMNNKDYSMALSRGRDISLMPGIGIRVADNDTLRYYLYSSGEAQT